MILPIETYSWRLRQVYGKVWISLVEVYERVERTLSLHPKGQKAHFMDVKTPKSFLAH